MQTPVCKQNLYTNNFSTHSKPVCNTFTQMTHKRRQPLYTSCVFNTCTQAANERNRRYTNTCVQTTQEYNMYTGSVRRKYFQEWSSLTQKPFCGLSERLSLLVSVSLMQTVSMLFLVRLKQCNLSLFSGACFRPRWNVC